MAYFCPRLEIKSNVTHSMITDKIREIIGEIKDELKFDKLATSDNIYNNGEFV